MNRRFLFLHFMHIFFALSQLSAMDNNHFTYEQQALIKTISGYEEFPFRATNRKITMLNNEILRLFAGKPSTAEKLHTQMMHIKIDRHILQLEKPQPDKRRCKNALFFLAKQCCKERQSKVTPSSCYCINRIKEICIDLPHTIKKDYNSFEHREYNKLLILMRYNPCFTPTTYNQNPSSIRPTLIKRNSTP